MKKIKGTFFFFYCFFLIPLTASNIRSLQQKMPIHKLWYKVAQQTNPQAISRAEKINFYEKTIQSAIDQNNKIPPKKTDAILRIMSYNIHFFKDSQGNSTLDRIMHIISTIQPDFLVLQEFYVENANEFDTQHSIAQKKLQHLGYTTIVGCKTFKHKALKEGDWFGNVIASKIKLDQQKSFFFKKQFVERGEERCYLYTKVTLPYSDKQLEIIGTHLEVADNDEKKYRLPQIQEIVSFPFNCPNHIIVADFNAVRLKDYDYTINNKNGWDLVVQENKAALNRSTPTLVFDALNKHNYIDSFSKLGWQGPHFTTWSGTTIDFFMLAPTFNLPLAGSYVYYDTASDHLPIILDIKLEKKKFKKRESI